MVGDTYKAESFMISRKYNNRSGIPLYYNENNPDYNNTLYVHFRQAYFFGTIDEQRHSTFIIRVLVARPVLSEKYCKKNLYNNSDGTIIHRVILKPKFNIKINKSSRLYCAK